MNQRWAYLYERCVECGTTELPHKGHGLCRRCYMRQYQRKHPHKRRIYTGKQMDDFVEALREARIGVQWDKKRLVLRQGAMILLDYTF